jgi:hypothetical protein
MVALYIHSAHQADGGRMTITQTVDIPANKRRLTIDIPRGVPAGKARLEVKVIPFVNKEESPASLAQSADNGKIRFTRKELDEMLQDCPITQRLSGILSDAGDVDLDDIRMARLAKHL